MGSLTNAVDSEAFDPFGPQMRQASGIHLEGNRDVGPHLGLTPQVCNRLPPRILPARLDADGQVPAGKQRGVDGIGHSRHIVVTDAVWVV